MNDTTPGQSAAPSGFWPPDGGGYRAAVVCRRGHVQASNLDDRPADAGRCPDCGTDYLTACGTCGLRIRGTSRQVVLPGGTAIAAGYVPPNFCDRCGGPHRWAPREAMLFELENILDQQDVDDADRLAVSEHLRKLRELDPDDDLEQERKRWAAVKRRAPQLLAGPGKMILEKLVDQATKKMLGIEP